MMKHGVPLLILVRTSEPDGVIFQCIPIYQEDKAACVFDISLQLVGLIPFIPIIIAWASLKAASNPSV